MTDIDRVFARFNRDASGSNERREQLTMRGRAGATGTRTVEVVRIRSGVSTPPKGGPRLDRQIRAASWEDGFPAKPGVAAAAAAEALPAKTIGHVMPAWERPRSRSQRLLRSRSQPLSTPRSRLPPSVRLAGRPGVWRIRSMPATMARTACGAAMRLSRQGRSAG